MTRATRRDFLRAGAAAALAATARAQLPSEPPSPLPRVNGGIVVQPLRRLGLGPGDPGPLIVPELVSLQLRAVYELGFERIRIPIAFHRFGDDFLAAIPYVRAARALGVQVLGIMGDFSGYDLPQALVQRESRAEVVGAYLKIFGGPVAPASSAIVEAGSLALQVLNEPTHFLGISPDSYVRDLLAPTFSEIKRQDPRLTVVSAAEVGNDDGVLRMRAMLEAGLERSCDRVAYHVYEREVIPLLAPFARKPVWITESGARGPENHLAWVRDAFPDMAARIPGTEAIFYFDLFDPEPRAFRLLELSAGADGSYQARVESPELVAHLAARVRQAAGDEPRAAYAELVPDLTPYLPTPEDLAVIEATSFR
jgi:hypothetical protein